jgi:ribosomal protein L11 methylase PrmA
MTFERISSSYRDPSGFVFRRDGEILRQINQSYRPQYECLLNSGLYQAAVEAQSLIAHQEVDEGLPEPENGWKIIRPKTVGFVSYPYEWSFSQLKDAALLTLEIQKQAMRHGMSLKDASAYNIQFDRGRPIFIDTLSFEQYEEGKPWVAYGQACRHFLAPLALMSLRDVRLNQLLPANLDGVPLDLASKLLPVRSKLRLSLLVHLHLHAKMLARHSGSTQKPPRSRKLGKTQLLGIIEDLESAIRRLNWKPGNTPWSDYYANTSYSAAGMDQKLHFVARCIEEIAPKMIWDLGANTGEFSRLASQRGILTIAFDSDPATVEKNYLRVKRENEVNLLPLLMDLTNPSPSIGWDNRERMTLPERGPADLVLALALVHHLAISGNVPLGRLADFLRRIARNLVIEFVPKSDPQAERLLVVRKDIFADYTQEVFELEFGRHFLIERRESVPDSNRILYRMTARNPA